MLRNLRYLVTAGAVLGLLAVPAFSATVIATTTYNFDASDTGTTATFKNGGGGALTPVALVGTAASHLGAGGTDGILGPFGNSAVGLVQNNQVVQMTITSPGPAFNAITLNFDLWVFNSWDGDGWTYTHSDGVSHYYTPDQFQVAVGGSMPSGQSCTGSALCTTFAMDYSDPALHQSYGGPNSAPMTGAATTRPGSNSPYFQNPGFGMGPGGSAGGTAPYTERGYAIYNINLGTLNLGSPVTSLTIYFRGLFSGELQTGWDESWGLGRVQYSATGPDVGNGEIPEPSTIALGGLGLALLALARLRRKA